MRSAVIGLLLSLVLPASALATTKTIAPPGNSGVSQYQEDVPTAKGNRPSNTIVPSGGTHGGGGSGGNVSSSTLRAFDKQGSAGRKAAALAEATAPTAPTRTRPTNGTGVTQSSGSSPVTSLVKALTGSSSNGGGLGPLLPIILIASLLGAGALALMRRRRAT